MADWQARMTSTRCQWTKKLWSKCHRTPVALARGLGPGWSPICAYHKQQRMGNPFMEYMPLPNDIQHNSATEES
jgi:hypothetical protein